MCVCVCVQLEQERSELIEEISSLKDKFSEAGAESREWETKWRQVEKEKAEHMQQKQEQLQQVGTVLLYRQAGSF